MSSSFSYQRHTSGTVPFQGSFSWQGSICPEAVSQLSSQCAGFDGCRNLDESCLQMAANGIGWPWLEASRRAYLYLTKKRDLGQLELLVHPEWRSQGWGNWLLIQGLNKLKSEGCQQVDIWAYGDRERSVAWLQRHGFSTQRLLHQMKRSVAPTQAPQWPPGWQLRPFDWQDFPKWWQLHQRLQSDPRRVWGRSQLELQAQQSQTPLSDFLLLWQGDILRGYTWGKSCNEHREVFLLAVDPDQRSLGMGTKLIQTLLCTHAGPWLAYCDSSREAALALYRKQGFTEVTRDRCLCLRW